MITKDLIEHIFRSCNGNPTSEYIYENLKMVENIRHAITTYQQEALKELHIYEIKKKEINRCITILQDKCPHWIKKYYSDPSGGNDSYHKCEICNKEL